MVFEGFTLADLSTSDVSKPLYQSIDMVKEIQYRLFTKAVFVDFLEGLLTNAEVLKQYLPSVLVFYELIIDFIFEAELNEQSSNLKDQSNDLNIAVLKERFMPLFETIKKQTHKFLATR